VTMTESGVLAGGEMFWRYLVVVPATTDNHDLVPRLVTSLSPRTLEVLSRMIQGSGSFRILLTVVGLREPSRTSLVSPSFSSWHRRHLRLPFLLTPLLCLFIWRARRRPAAALDLSRF